MSTFQKKVVYMSLYTYSMYMCVQIYITCFMCVCVYMCIFEVIFSERRKLKVSWDIFEISSLLIK